MKESSEESPTMVIPSPFPNRFAWSKKEEEEREILKMFHNVEKLNGNDKVYKGKMRQLYYNRNYLLSVGI